MPLCSTNEGSVSAEAPQGSRNPLCVGMCVCLRRRRGQYIHMCVCVCVHSDRLIENTRGGELNTVCLLSVSYLTPLPAGPIQYSVYNGYSMRSIRQHCMEAAVFAI